MVGTGRYECRQQHHDRSVRGSARCVAPPSSKRAGGQVAYGAVCMSVRMTCAAPPEATASRCERGTHIRVAQLRKIRVVNAYGLKRFRTVKADDLVGKLTEMLDRVVRSYWHRRD